MASVIRCVSSEDDGTYEPLREVHVIAVMTISKEVGWSQRPTCQTMHIDHEQQYLRSSLVSTVLA